MSAAGRSQTPLESNRARLMNSTQKSGAIFWNSEQWDNLVSITHKYSFKYTFNTFTQSEIEASYFISSGS